MYLSAREAVQGRKLKVQELAIPFTITGHATPASKTIVRDEPSVLFLQCEGIDQITEAAGAVVDDSTLPTMSAESDANGRFYCAVKLGEASSKVVSAQFISRASTENVACTVLASADSGALLIVLVDSAVDLSAANIDGCLVIRYIV